MKASLCSSGHSAACLSRFFTSGRPPTSSQLQGQALHERFLPGSDLAQRRLLA